MTADEVLTQAEEALKRGDASGADAGLNRMWPNDDGNTPHDALHMRATVRFAQERFSDAETLLSRAIAAEPRSLRHHIALGHLFTSQRSHRRAAEAYADALNLDERWPGLLHVFALACYRSGRYANVESAARRWIAMAPSADAWDTLSCALRAQGKAAEALSAAETALKLAPDHVQAQHSKGAALLRLGRQEEALVLFEALSELGVNAPALFLYRGQALQGLNRVQEAAEVFLAGLAAAPSSVALQHAYTSVKPN